MKRPYLLKKRRKYFYYRLADELTFHSTGRSVESKAHNYVMAIIQEKKEKKESFGELNLKEYTRDFFIWDRCAWIHRQHAKGRSFSPSVAKSRRGHLDNHILPKFGRKPLIEINPVEVENWLVSLQLANQTKNHILYTLGIVLREAKRERRIPFNPLADVESLGIRPKKPDTLSSKELEKLFPRDRKEFKKVWPILWHGVLYALAASSGMRSGELRALKWGAVLWTQGGVLVLEAVQDDNSIGDPKGRSRRAIPLPQRTMDLLQWWHSLCRYPDPGDYVFAGATDRPVSRRTVSLQLHPGLEKAKIDTDGRTIVVHSLRHTYNTKMKELLTGEVLRSFTGHKTEEMTEHYDRPFLEERLKSYDPHKPQVEKFWKKEKDERLPLSG